MPGSSLHRDGLSNKDEKEQKTTKYKCPHTPSIIITTTMTTGHVGPTNHIFLVLVVGDPSNLFLTHIMISKTPSVTLPKTFPQFPSNPYGR